MVRIEGLRVRLQQGSRQLHSQRALRHLHNTSKIMPQCNPLPTPRISAVLCVKGELPAKLSIMWWELRAHHCAQ